MSGSQISDSANGPYLVPDESTNMRSVYGFPIYHHMHPIASSLLHKPSYTPIRLRFALLNVQRRYSDSGSQSARRASAKLFEDAANEEAELAEQAARASKIEALRKRDENWTGEESIQDAVLRMLVDKYKPLRSGPIRSADEKLRKAPPQVGATEPGAIDTVDALRSAVDDSVVVKTAWGASSGRSLADVPLLPHIEGHQPWLTTFTVPSHAQSSIKYGNIPPSATTSRLPPNPEVLDDKAKRKLRETKKRTEQAGRLRNAKESTLDYRLGIKSPKRHEGVAHQRPNPTSLRGWTSLVEDRIERARQEGRFDRIQGRGKPLKQFVEERNPFIAREEFLLNRIVQRQGAAPPWVEVQQELELTVNSFRDVLRQSWTRRAIRMLTLSQPPGLLTNLTLDKIIAFRDVEWEARERGYHNTAIEEVNSLVRKYNGMSPYAVRRGHYALDVELERAYRESAEDILEGITRRVKAGPSGTSSLASTWDDERESTPRSGDTNWSPIRIRDVIREWVGKLARR